MHLPAPTASATDIKNNSLTLLDSLWKEGFSLPVRALTVTAIYLIGVDDYVPTSIFEEEKNALKNTRLEKSIDRIRDKYGFDIIRRGNLVDEKDRDFDEESKPFKKQ